MYSLFVLITKGWLKIEGAEFAPVRASLTTENTTYNCIATVIARSGCWSFLKGGFVLDYPSNMSVLYFKVNVFHKSMQIKLCKSTV